jgi:ribosome-associated protein
VEKPIYFSTLIAIFEAILFIHPNLKAYLEPLNVLSSREKSGSTRLNARSKILKTIVHAIQEKKGENLISLDLRKIPEAVADYFIICEATNTTQLGGIADYVEEEVKKHCGERPFMHEGNRGQQWVLIDYINVVVHIMMPEARKFYKLEEMWSDAAITEHEE